MNTRWVRYSLFALIMAGVLALGNMLFSNILRIDGMYYVACVSLNFGSMFVGTCLVGALIFDRHYGPYNRVCAVMLSLIVMVLASDSLGLYFWRAEESGRAAFIFLNLEYYLTTLVLYAMVMALKEFVEPDAGRHRLMLKVSAVPVLFESVLLIQNIWTGNLWCMEGTVLVHGPLYPLMFLAPVLQELLNVFACMYLAEDRKLGLKYACFMLFSLMSLVFMLPHYYATVNYLAALFPMMLVIPYEYNRRGKEIREGERRIKERNDAMKVAQLNIREVESTLFQIENLNGMPDAVSEALGKFRKFIGENYESFNKPSMIPLETELEFTKAYLYLEKLRFKSRLDVEYHINSTSFYVPSLSMQVLVENAVKHGISKRPEGGKVVISVDAFRDYYMIVVEDNGVGFDTALPRSSERSHVGVDNISSRLADMADGQLFIESTIGVGTTSTVIIPKRGQ